MDEKGTEVPIMSRDAREERVTRALFDPMTQGHIEDTIHLLQNMVEDINICKGWYDEARTFGDDIALLHSEVTEAFEAWRGHGLADVTDRDVGMAKPEGVASELADILIRVFDTSKRYDIDLGAALLAKMLYNTTRPYRHGGKKV